jgi:hypothetical protein
MEIGTITTTVLTASEGYILTDGEVYGRVIYLASDRKPDEFYEITEDEYQEIMKGETENEIERHD